MKFNPAAGAVNSGINVPVAKSGFVGLCLFIILASAPLYAQMIQPYKLVDGHTAGVLGKGHYDLDFRIYAPGGEYGTIYGTGLITGFRVGVTPRLTLGLSYGGEGLIGYSDNVRWNPYPGVMVKYRLFEEKLATPAFTIGFDNQGYGGPADRAIFGYNGYVFKSPGFFIALSKNYLMFNVVQVGMHGTVNYSLEERENVKWPNAMTGLDIGINDELAILAEYDLALNDISGDEYKNGCYANPFRGYLNIGLRWAFTSNFHIEFDVKDVLEHKIYRPPTYPPEFRRRVGWSRELKVLYLANF
jgi:hypothetical protein